jgi:hypothetical protein
MTTVSKKLSEMSLEELVMLNQGLGREVDKLREQRAHVNKLIASHIHAKQRQGVEEQIARLRGQLAPAGDAEAPGAEIEVQAKG